MSSTFSRLVGAAGIVAACALAAPGAAGAAEYGHCQELTKQTSPKAKRGRYEESNCQKSSEKRGKPQAKGNFEWFPGPYADCLEVKKGEETSEGCSELAAKAHKGRYESQSTWLINGEPVSEGGAARAADAAGADPAASGTDTWYIRLTPVGGVPTIVKCTVKDEHKLSAHGDIDTIEVVGGGCPQVSPKTTGTVTWLLTTLSVKVPSDTQPRPEELVRPPQWTPEQSLALGGEMFPAAAPPGMFGDAEEEERWSRDVLRGLSLKLQASEGGQTCEIKGNLAGEFDNATESLDYPESDLTQTKLEGSGCSEVNIYGEGAVTPEGGDSLQLGVPYAYGELTGKVKLVNSAATVECQQGASFGEITGSKSGRDLIMFFGCEASGTPCTSLAPGEPEGDIAGILETTLIGRGERGLGGREPAEGEVWTEYSNRTGREAPSIATFHCAGVGYVEVNGSISARIAPLNTSTTDFMLGGGGEEDIATTICTDRAYTECPEEGLATVEEVEADKVQSLDPVEIKP